jgi:hypothetical protein
MNRIQEVLFRLKQLQDRQEDIMDHKMFIHSATSETNPHVKNVTEIIADCTEYEQ